MLPTSTTTDRADHLSGYGVVKSHGTFWASVVQDRSHLISCQLDATDLFTYRTGFEAACRPEMARTNTTGTVYLRFKAFCYSWLSHLTSLGSLVRSAVTVFSRPRFAYFITPGGS